MYQRVCKNGGGVYMFESAYKLYVRADFERKGKELGSLSISIYRANSTCQALFQMPGNNSKQKIQFHLS